MACVCRFQEDARVWDFGRVEETCVGIRDVRRLTEVHHVWMQCYDRGRHGRRLPEGSIGWNG